MTYNDFCNLTGKQKNEAEKAAGGVRGLISIGHRQNQTRMNGGGGVGGVQDKHTGEMHSKLSRRLIKSTLIKMLTETLWIYERGLTPREKKQHSARAKVTICQVLSRCTESHRHIAGTYARGLPHMSPRLLKVFFCFVFFCFGLFLFCFCYFSCCSYCRILFYTKFNYATVCIIKKGKQKIRCSRLQDEHLITNGGWGGGSTRVWARERI